MPALVEAALLGGLDRTGLAAAMRPLWEDAGPLVDRMVGVGVSSWDDHLAAARSAIASMDERARAELLQAHPRIGADPAALIRTSTSSWREQGAATRRDPAVSATLATLNDEYEDRFGFPFVEWVAGRTPEAIAEVLSARLERGRDAEMEAGCAALVSIATDRLSQLQTVAA